MNPTIAGNLKSKTTWAAIALMALGALEQSGLLALIPDNYKGIAISAVGALMLFLRNLTTTSIAEKGAQGGFARVGMLVLLAVMASTFLAGCVTTPDGGRELSNTGRATLQLLAGELTDRYLIESPDRLRSIANIQGIAAKLANVTDAVTITELRAKLDEEVEALSLSDLDRRSAKRWLTLLEGLLRDYVGRDQLDSAALVRVNDFLGIVVGVLPAV